MQKESRRWMLRERTAASHHKLDSLVGEVDSDAAYARYLIGIAAFRSAVEPSLGKCQLLGGAYRPTCLLPEVIADLSDLGIAKPTPARFELQLLRDATLGALYVLEGSSLGAQLLVKRANALGYHGAYGARHLIRQTASLDGWRNYLAALEGATLFDFEACASGANAAFDAALTAFGTASYA